MPEIKLPKWLEDYNNIKKIAFTGSHGTGKAQPLYSKILTPNGWKIMGDTKIGDKIYGRDGNVYTIVNIFPQGKKEVYEIEFTDHTKTRSTLDHLWIAKNNSRNVYKVVELNKIFNDYTQNKHKKYFRKWNTPHNDKIQFNSNTPLPIHPYLFGVLLGDGGFTDGCITLTIGTHKSEIYNICESLLPDNIQFSIRAEKDGCIDYRLTQIISNENGKKSYNNIKQSIQKLGLLKLKSFDKFIPDVYLYTSIENRINLLQGLLDTDGCIEKRNSSRGNLVFYSTSIKLIEGVEHLVRSLGGRCIRYNKTTKYNYVSGDKNICNSFALHISLPIDIPISKLQYKIDNYNGIKKYPLRKVINSISFIENCETQCIQVDSPDGSYITDDYIVTHNTTATFETATTLKMLLPNKKITLLTELAADCPFPINKETQQKSQMWIFVNQMSKEIEKQKRYDVLVCDRTICDVIAYTKNSHFDELASVMFNEAINYVNTYDVIVFNTIKNNPYHFKDGIRDSDDTEFRQKIEDYLLDVYDDMFKYNTALSPTTFMFHKN